MAGLPVLYNSCSREGRRKHWALSRPSRGTGALLSSKRCELKSCWDNQKRSPESREMKRGRAAVLTGERFHSGEILAAPETSKLLDRLVIDIGPVGKKTHFILFCVQQKRRFPFLFFKKSLTGYVKKKKPVPHFPVKFKPKPPVNELNSSGASVSFPLSAFRLRALRGRDLYWFSTHTGGDKQISGT